MGRPVKPCRRCDGQRRAGQRVSVEGRRVPACARCARAPWGQSVYARDRRRGSGHAYAEVAA